MDKGVALITGASRGVGRALAIGLARDGYRIVAMARSFEMLQTIAKEAGVAESDVLPIAVDMGDEASIIAAVKAIPATFGPLRIVVNNAAKGLPGSLELPFSTFQSVLNTNLAGPFRLLQEVVPFLIREKQGTIINVASQAGKTGFAGWGVYGASKFGLVGLGESLYRELAAHGIKVTTLCPSWIDTEMAPACGSPLMGEQMIQPEDLMKTVRWLLSLSPAACVREVSIECRDTLG